MRQYLRHIYYALPLSCRKWVRRLYFMPKDIFSNADAMIPPEGKNFIGSGDFIATGKEFLSYFKEFQLIHPDAQILEIGCGMGRMALPFKDYLSKNGHYTGIDIVEEGISWCKTKITPEDSRFTYIHAPIFNTLYNPKSKIYTKDYLLPLSQDTMDFVFLTSVFTHLLPEDVAHYFSEIKRVLKPGGHLLATFFIVDKKRLYNPSIHFAYTWKNHYTINKNIPEANVGYPEDYILALCTKNGLTVKKILYGSWTGNKEYTSFQDIIITQKND